MADEVFKSVGFPTFSKKIEHFQMWWIKFQAFASVKHFEDALIVNAVLPTSKADANAMKPTDVVNNKDIKAHKQNKMAVV